MTPIMKGKGEVEAAIISGTEEVEGAPARKANARQSSTLSKDDESQAFEWMQDHDVLLRNDKDVQKKSLLWDDLAKFLDGRYTADHLKRWWKTLTTIFEKLYKCNFGQAAVNCTD